MTQYPSLGQLIDVVLQATEDAVDGPYTQALDESIRIIQDWEREMYLGQHGPNGAAWAPLSPVTIARKEHSAILVDTGRMFESLTTPNGTEDTVWITGPTWLTFGTEVPYAHFHQTGTKRMPARPHVGVNEATVTLIGQRLADAVAARINQGIN